MESTGTASRLERRRPPWPISCTYQWGASRVMLDNTVGTESHPSVVRDYLEGSISIARGSENREPSEQRCLRPKPDFHTMQIMSPTASDVLRSCQPLLAPTISFPSSLNRQRETTTTVSPRPSVWHSRPRRDGTSAGGVRPEDPVTRGWRRTASRALRAGRVRVRAAPGGERGKGSPYPYAWLLIPASRTRLALIVPVPWQFGQSVPLLPSSFLPP